MELALPNSRNLLCVVFADMVGYSALTSRDEIGTHKMWMEFRRDVLEPLTEKTGGEIIRMLGDGVLVTFSSGTNAIDWCTAIQEQILEGRRGMTKRYPGLSMRCAAHLCEAISDGEDVYGDGVNIAKRLQESISADGIIISEDLYNSVRSIRDIPTRKLGYVTMKNIANPISALEVLVDTRQDHVGLKRAKLELPSIAVMPLQNLGYDEDSQYFADGVVEDIISSLASLKELIVISRASTIALDKNITDPREIGRILDVRYVLNGAIRMSGDKIRISVALCDTQSGEIVFSEKSDIRHTELFETQDRITEYIVARIAPNVRAAERVNALRKPPDNFTAYDLTLKALDLMTRLTKETYEQALGFLEQAMALDPDFAMPVAYAGRLKCQFVGQGWASDRAEAIRSATETASRAVNMDRQNALALATMGHAKSYLERDYDTALVLLDRSRELGPSLSLAWSLSSATLSYTGSSAEAVEHAKHALRLSPYDPDLYQTYGFLAIAHYINRDFDEAVKWCEKSYREKPEYTSNWRVSVFANAGAGRIAKASEFAKLVLKDMPDFTVEKYLQEICPFRDEQDRKMVAEHLRIAGLK